MIDVEKIIQVTTRLFPASKVNDFHPYWKEAFEYADINTNVRAAMFIGQVGIECKYFRSFEEDLANYKPETLVKTWGTRFRMPVNEEEKKEEIFDDAKRNPYKFVKQPVKLANFVYGGRFHNGNEASGDGWKYRGRGPKQITFKDNYERFTSSLGKLLKADFVKNPDLVLNPKNGLYAAVWFWKTNKINTYADIQNVQAVTKIVNGGNAKVKERGLLSQQALQLLNA